MRTKDVEMSRLREKLRHVLGDEADVLIVSIMRLESASIDSSYYVETELINNEIKMCDMFRRHMLWTLWMIGWACFPSLPY